jgi:hypothetical protein
LPAGRGFASTSHAKLSCRLPDDFRAIKSEKLL